MTTAPAVKLGRCNPYGAETGGPRRVLGGLYGPASATTPGMGLPANVEQGEWICPQLAVGRFRMECRCGHPKGQIMPLCSWHDETVYQGEYVAGKIRRVSRTVRVHGHYEEIQRRQAGFCPPCGFPGPFAAYQKEVQRLAYDLAVEYALNGGSLKTPRAQAITRRTEEIGALFDAARAVPCPHCPQLIYVREYGSPCDSHRPVDLTTAVHNCPLILVPVS